MSAPDTTRPDARERARMRMEGLAKIARDFRDSGDPERLAEGAFILGAVNDFCEYVDELRDEAEAWLEPFDGSGIEWHGNLSLPYTYQAADFNKLVAAVHEYECALADARASRPQDERATENESGGRGGGGVQDG